MNVSTRLLITLAVIALLGIGIWWSLGRKTPTPNATSNAPAATLYSDATLGFQVTLPPGWSRVTSAGLNGDVVFQSNAARGCGCAVYVTREDNTAGLGIDAWLTTTSGKKDSYMSQEEYDRRRSSLDPSERTLAGTYKESSVTLAGTSATLQEYQSEGGGYVRYLIARGSSVYSLTLSSDGYYFTDTAKQTRFDGGQLRREVDALIGSFAFLE